MSIEVADITAKQARSLAQSYPTRHKDRVLEDMLTQIYHRAEHGNMGLEVTVPTVDVDILGPALQGLGFRVETRNYVLNKKRMAYTDLIISWGEA